ncbi:hypothetical protein [Amycolatopsis orientalis]|uniref:hypothetical protein n=1 Tax=Amycolatopsis orientalis TaxID=31958 RepID=UPI00039A62F0|nr:hypothetical protein [Amycolatopsis orientalis]
MTVEADPREVAAANLSGRLHPSQRGEILDIMFWIMLGIVVVFVALAVVLPLTTGMLSGPNAGQSWAAAPFWLALIVAGVVLCARRYRALSDPVVVITGWTHDFDSEKPPDRPYVIAKGLDKDRYGNKTNRKIAVGGKQYWVSRAMYAQIQGDRNNTVCVVPRATKLLNAFPAG